VVRIHEGIQCRRDAQPQGSCFFTLIGMSSHERGGCRPAPATALDFRHFWTFTPHRPAADPAIC
jgi:hypothetical protein